MQPRKSDTLSTVPASRSSRYPRGLSSATRPPIYTATVLHLPPWISGIDGPTERLTSVVVVVVVQPLVKDQRTRPSERGKKDPVPVETSLVRHEDEQASLRGFQRELLRILGWLRDELERVGERNVSSRWTSEN